MLIERATKLERTILAERNNYRKLREKEKSEFSHIERS